MNPHGDIVTNIGAGAAIISPWWLPALREWSEVAGLCLPILGCTWLVIQIGYKLYKEKK